MDKSRRQEILDWLDGSGVAYTLWEHPAAFDMEDIEAFGVTAHGEVCKNLFLRDSKKGKRHLLVSVLGSQRVNLGELGAAIGERLSFASENRLGKYLNLKKGEVTPLGVYFDKENAVEVFFDKRLCACKVVGVHPADNTATVFLAPDDLISLVEGCGNRVTIIDIQPQ